MATVLEPNDPLLGNSYEDGVERARRVNMKKKKKPDGMGDTPPVAPGTPEDIAMLQEGGLLPKGTDPNALAATQLAGGWAGYQDNSQAGSLYYISPGDLEKQRKLRKPPSTVLGG